MKGVSASEVLISQHEWRNSGVSQPQHDLIVGTDTHKEFVLTLWRTMPYIKLDYGDIWYDNVYKDKMHLKLEKLDKQGKYASALKIVKRNSDFCLFHIFNTTFDWGIVRFIPFQQLYPDFCHQVNEKLNQRKK